MHKLWRHTNGTFYVLYGVRLKKRVSTRSRDRRQAETFLSQFIAGTQNPVIQNPMVGELLADYETEHSGEVRSPDAIKFSVASLKRHLCHYQPRALTPPVIKDYAKKRREEGVGAGTILREVGSLRAALSWAVEHRRIEAADKPPISNPVKVPKPRDRWLTKEEARRLIAACREPHIKLFVTLGLMTVPRTSAMLELKWEQVNFERKTIDYGEGHGNKRRAVVPLNHEVFDLLEAAKKLGHSEYVIEYHGEPVESVKNGFRKARARAGLGKDVTPHILRHSGATWMALDGVPLREIARMLGDSEAMVERVYAKYHPDYLRSAASALQLAPAA